MEIETESTDCPICLTIINSQEYSNYECLTCHNIVHEYCFDQYTTNNLRRCVYCRGNILVLNHIYDDNSDNETVIADYNPNYTDYNSDDETVNYYLDIEMDDYSESLQRLFYEN